MGTSVGVAGGSLTDGGRPQESSALVTHRRDTPSRRGRSTIPSGVSNQSPSRALRAPSAVRFLHRGGDRAEPLGV